MVVFKHVEAYKAQPVEAPACSLSSRNRFFIVNEASGQTGNIYLRDRLINT